MVQCPCPCDSLNIHEFSVLLPSNNSYVLLGFLFQIKHNSTNSNKNLDEARFNVKAKPSKALDSLDVADRVPGSKP